MKIDVGFEPFSVNCYRLLDILSQISVPSNPLVAYSSGFLLMLVSFTKQKCFMFKYVITFFSHRLHFIYRPILTERLVLAWRKMYVCTKSLFFLSFYRSHNRCE